MSYKPYENQDELSELISKINDFLFVKTYMIENKEDSKFNNFILWFDKAKKISIRDTVLFFEDKDNMNLFGERIQQYVKLNLNRYFNKREKFTKEDFKI